MKKLISILSLTLIAQLLFVKDSISEDVCFFSPFHHENFYDVLKLCDEDDIVHLEGFMIVHASALCKIETIVPIAEDNVLCVYRGTIRKDALKDYKK